MNNVPENSPLQKFLEQNYSLENLNSCILNDIDAFVFIVDVEHLRPVWLNDFFFKRLHYRPEDLETLTTEKFFATFHEKSLANFKERMKDFKNNAHPGKRSIYQIRTKDYEWIYMLVSSRVYQRNPDGSVKLLLGFGTELTKLELERQKRQILELENRQSDNSLINKLSKREIDVVRLITWGLTDNEIAFKLSISSHTAKTHRKRIISKLGLKNTAALVKFAVENDLD